MGDYFKPLVLNHMEKHRRKAGKDIDGYMVCFENRGNVMVRVVFDVVLVSEFFEDDESNDGIRKEALTPLEAELATSINAANSIVSEMRFMEHRETRMRVTTESINQRIRVFSYISVIVLLTVTYLQVTYLKRYFKKK